MTQPKIPNNIADNLASVKIEEGQEHQNLPKKTAKTSRQKEKVTSDNGEEGLKCPRCSFVANTFDHIRRHVKRKHTQFYDEFLPKYDE